tara:strand:+ start:50 stop:529 length:480 start_codon:yes stop_codon:yes gene_type:complete
MKFIYSIISILILAVTVLAAGHHMKHPMQEQLAQAQVPVDPTTPQFHQFQVVQPQSSSLNELPNQLVDMFMGQGIVGAMLIVLGFWFYKTESQARQDRIKLTDKFEQLVRDSLDKTDWIEVKSGIAALDARMQNVERELELLSRDSAVITGKIGNRNNG